MPAETPPARKGRKMPQVLEGARTIFLRDGFEGASVDDIARAAGVSKATLYSYFPDKRLLFLEVAKAECLRQSEEAVALITADLAPRAVLTLAATRIVAFVLSDFGIRTYRICVAEADRFPSSGTNSTRAARRSSGSGSWTISRRPWAGASLPSTISSWRPTSSPSSARRISSTASSSAWATASARRSGRRWPRARSRCSSPATRPGPEAPPHKIGRGPQRSKVAKTGAWSDGCSQPRAALRMRLPCAALTMSGVAQIWSSRRPLSAASQSGER